MTQAPTAGAISGHSGTDALSPAQHRALRALLETTTIRAAAENSGLSDRTIKRYLANKDFAAVYRQQRALILQEISAALQQAGQEAVAVLRATAKNENPELSLRGAQALLSYIVRVAELERRIVEQEDVLER